MQVRLLLISLFFIAKGQTQEWSSSIQLNQIGFYTESKKVAVISKQVSALNFYITSTNFTDTVFKGVLGNPIQSKHSSTVTRIADFSSVKKEGSFVLVIPGLGHSPIFYIGNDIFLEVGKASLKGFYYQRISMPLASQYAGKWHRSSGHPDTDVEVHSSAATVKRPIGTKLPMPGGWYDAGDYNKYIVNSGITTATLLSAYEFNKEYYHNLSVNIPESSNNLPDILDEVLYNLRWMLAMQDPNDGGVYHKCTNAIFDDMVMPGVTKATRYVVQKSTAAALDFTAVMAQSSRIFASFQKELPGFSDSCLKASLSAWQWALNNPAVIYDQNKMNLQHLPKIETGAYGDGYLKDEWMWAGAELFCTTKDQKYLTHLDELDQTSMVMPAWDKVALLGFYSLLNYQGKIPEEYSGKWEMMRSKLLGMADDYLSYASQSAFQVVMGNKDSDFIWGSNSNAANQGILLLYVSRYTGKKIYQDAAFSNGDYLLGRNATGYCFVTGFGSKSPMHPHHRQSEADGIVDPVPGLLVGGPNPYRQDKCQYKYIERETAFTDDVCSYASNEIAINWNAPAVFLFNALHSTMQKK